MDEDFAKLYLFIGLTGTFSRPAGGLLCQVNRIKALLVFQMSIAILGIMFLLLPVLSSYRLLVIFSLLFGVGDGLLVTSTNVSALKCFKDPVKKTSGYGILMLFTSVAFGVGPPLSGMLLGNAIFRERKVPYNMYQGGHHCMGDTMNRKGVGGPLSGMTLDNPLHGLPLLLTLFSAIYGEGVGPPLSGIFFGSTMFRDRNTPMQRQHCRHVCRGVHWVYVHLEKKFHSEMSKRGEKVPPRYVGIKECARSAQIRQN